MPDSVGELMGRALAGACLTLILSTPAAAQRPLADAPDSIEFLPRLDLNVSAQALSGDDPRFIWETTWAMDLDFLDYKYGRLAFLTDFQGFYGDEFQPFDPNQSLYSLVVAASGRIGKTEAVAVFHHVSRHLIDRPKNFGIAWNTVRGRVQRRFPIGSSFVDLRWDIGNVIQRAYVDYRWTTAVEAQGERPMSPRTTLFGRGSFEYWGVIEEKAGRDAQSGGRFEAGVRFAGKPGGVGPEVEVFGGVEKMVDAHPIERGPQTWGFLGFRLVP